MKLAIVGLACCLVQIQSLKLTQRSGWGSDQCAPFDVLKGDEQPTSLGDLLGKSGGAWTPCTHLHEYGLNFAPFFATFLAHQLKPKTALEFGCGLGTMSDFVARNINARVACIEPDESLAKLISTIHGGNQGLLRPLAMNVFDEKASACRNDLETSKFDLVTSFEVAEHIPFKHHEALVNFLVNSTGKWLVFSAARPDQVGTGHLKESSFDKEHWLQIFKNAGLVYMPMLTQIARESAYWHRSYDLFGNTLVFKHPSNPAIDTREADEHLMHSQFSGPANMPGFHQNPPDFIDRAGIFARGVEAALWPEMSNLRQKLLDGTASCENTTKQV